jgi:hypothetical protein
MSDSIEQSIHEIQAVITRTLDLFLNACEQIKQLQTDQNVLVLKIHALEKKVETLELKNQNIDKIIDNGWR